jgi:hypothetical protein
LLVIESLLSIVEKKKNFCRRLPTPEARSTQCDHQI